MKVVSILDTVAKVKSCLVMLDLEHDALIVKKFQNFLKIIRYNHSRVVFSAMETNMTMVIDESLEISHIAQKLGEKVITNCAVKLTPYLKEAMGVV